MLRKIGWLTLSAGLSSLWAWQAPPAAPAKPDSTEVTAHVEKAKKIAGSTWASEARFFCLVPRPNSPKDPLIEPAKIFDNLYAIRQIGDDSLRDYHA